MAATASPPPRVIPQLIVGLGNPGTKYEGTRHNVGFAALDTLAKTWQVPWSERRQFHGFFAEGPGPQGQRLRLLKPTTFMNRSGQSIRAVVDWFKLPEDSVLVIYDDMDLPTGRLRLRLSGSAGGHNGMKSAIAHLGTQNFPRLRIGIGRPSELGAEVEGETISHVLGRFSPSEDRLLTQALDQVISAVELSLRQGVEQAMNRYNAQSNAQDSAQKNNPKTTQNSTQKNNQTTSQKNNQTIDRNPSP